MKISKNHLLQTISAMINMHRWCKSIFTKQEKLYVEVNGSIYRVELIEIQGKTLEQINEEEN